ncbi:MAG: hypothetical protein AAF433_21400 [Bacteroidota bacterium]
MALAILTLACGLFYASSAKYFPLREVSFLQENRRILLPLGGVVALLAFYFFYRQYDFATALMIWSVGLMALLSAIIVSVKMNQQWIWAWGALSVISLLTDLL